MEFWNNIYFHFTPIAFSVGSFAIHWYAIMYITALLTALYFAKWIVKKDNLNISDEDLDNYFIYMEVGVILGARLGYILFYDPHTLYYLTHPWQIFNPFMNGEFVGIRGFSYHGALIGALISTYIFTLRYKQYSYWFIMDLVAIAVPFGYVFGRIGNFLNQELIGRTTDLPIGIYVDGVLRHPSQLYEAFLEGILLFIIIFLYRKRKKFDGELIIIYIIGYSIARYIAEFFRQPDFQLGFICCNMVTMGQLLSFIIIISGIILYYILLNKDKDKKLDKN